MSKKKMQDISQIWIWHEQMYIIFIISKQDGNICLGQYSLTKMSGQAQKDCHYQQFK